MAKTKLQDIGELKPDDKNFNKGNDKGRALVEKSMERFGPGRSILLDKNNNIIAGNVTAEKYAKGGGEKVLVAETTGDVLVAVKRKDIDLNTPKGRELALADNATAINNIVFDAELIETELGEAVAEQWGVDTLEDDQPPKKIKEINTEAYRLTHVLLSFPPDKMIHIQHLLEEIIKIEGVQYEQASN